MVLPWNSSCSTTAASSAMYLVLALVLAQSEHAILIWLVV